MRFLVIRVRNKNLNLEIYLNPKAMNTQVWNIEDFVRVLFEILRPEQIIIINKLLTKQFISYSNILFPCSNINILFP